MGLMLNLTIPVEGIMALRTALGEERAIAVARALEHAHLRGMGGQDGRLRAQII